MRYIILLLSILLVGCSYDDKNTKRAKNQEPMADRNETKYNYNGIIEGCRLFHVRPRYGGHFHLAICDSSARATWKESCGKNCTRDAFIETDIHE